VFRCYSETEFKGNGYVKDCVCSNTIPIMPRLFLKVILMISYGSEHLKYHTQWNFVCLENMCIKGARNGYLCFLTKQYK